MKKNEYEVQAENFAKKYFVSIDFEYLGHFVRNDVFNVSVSQWKVTFSRFDRKFSLTFSQSINESWEYRKEYEPTYTKAIKGIDQRLSRKSWEKLKDGAVLLGNRYKAVKHEPTIYDVLSCITKNDPGTFNDFCLNYGYNNDSIKDFNLYQEVCEEWQEVHAIFSDCLDELQEIC